MRERAGGSILATGVQSRHGAGCPRRAVEGGARHERNGWIGGWSVHRPAATRADVRAGAAGSAGAPTVVLLHGWATTAGAELGAELRPALRSLPGRRPRPPWPRPRAALRHPVPARGLRGRRRCAARHVGHLAVHRRRLLDGRPDRPAPVATPSDVVAGLVLCATSATFHGTPRERLLSGLATGGSFVAASPPFQPVLAAATTVMRGLRAVGHDWTRIAEAGREICRFDSRPWIHELAAVPTAVIATTGTTSCRRVASWSLLTRSPTRRCAAWRVVTPSARRTRGASCRRWSTRAPRWRLASTPWASPPDRSSARVVGRRRGGRVPGGDGRPGRRPPPGRWPPHRARRSRRAGRRSRRELDPVGAQAVGDDQRRAEHDEGEPGDAAGDEVRDLRRHAVVAAPRRSTRGR